MNTPTPEQIDAALAYLDSRRPSSEHQMNLIEDMTRARSRQSREIISSVDTSLAILAAAFTAARTAGTVIASGQAGPLIAARQSTDTP